MKPAALAATITSARSVPAASISDPLPDRWLRTKPPLPVSRTPSAAAPVRVMTLITPRKALAPYSADPGPRITSIRSMACIGISSSPKKLPVLGRKGTACPSIISLRTEPLARAPPLMPRMPTLWVARS